MPIVQLLASRNAPLNAQDNEGGKAGWDVDLRAWQKLVEKWDLEVVLRTANACLCQGRTPARLAKEEGHERVASILEEIEARIVG